MENTNFLKAEKIAENSNTESEQHLPTIEEKYHIDAQTTLEIFQRTAKICLIPKLGELLDTVADLRAMRVKEKKYLNIIIAEGQRLSDTLHNLLNIAFAEIGFFQYVRNHQENDPVVALGNDKIKISQKFDKNSDNILRGFVIALNHYGNNILSSLVGAASIYNRLLQGQNQEIGDALTKIEANSLEIAKIIKLFFSLGKNLEFTIEPDPSTDKLIIPELTNYSLND